MPPRRTDWTLALGTGLAFATGLAGNLIGRPEGQWVFALHGMAGFALALFLIPKLRRVLPRLTRRAGWNRTTVFGLLATARRTARGRQRRRVGGGRHARRGGL